MPRGAYELTDGFVPPEVVLHLDSMTPYFLRERKARGGSRAFTEGLGQMLKGVLATSVEIGPAMSSPLGQRQRTVARRALQSAQFPLEEQEGILEIEAPKSKKGKEQANAAIAQALLERAQNRVVGVISSEPAGLGKSLLQGFYELDDPVRQVVLAARASEKTFYEFTDALYFGFSIMPYLKQDSIPGSLTVAREEKHGVPFTFTALELSGEPYEAGVQLGRVLWGFAQKIPKGIE